MPNENTRIQDVIIPEIFTQYVIERTAELSVILTSGIATPNPTLNQLVTGGGATIIMPQWNDLTGESQVMSDSRDITTKKITSAKDIAVLLVRAAAWSTHELAGVFAGSDPMGAIVQLVAAWWARDEQRILINVLNGVFESPSMQDLVLPAATEPIGPDIVLDGKQLLGDAAGKLAAIAMHSATFTELQKQNLIEYIPNARGEIVIPTYLTYRVIVDDGMPVDTSGIDKVFTTYLFASGVIGRGEGVPPTLTPTETERVARSSTDILINRRAFVLHPMGVKWQGSIADPEDATPANSDLAVGSAWDRVYELKNMGIVKLQHKL